MSLALSRTLSLSLSHARVLFVSLSVARSHQHPDLCSSYPEAYPPNSATKTTSWDMSGIDQYMSDFCAATKHGDCSETNIFIGPLPPWLYHTSLTDLSICNASNPASCTGELVDPSGRAAGEYYSRIVSWFTRGYLIDEFGNNHTGGHHFNFTHWEVLNEPNLHLFHSMTLLSASSVLYCNRVLF